MDRDSQSHDVERQIASLGDLPHRDLAARWRNLHGTPPPKGLSRRLMLLALAYRIQADAYGHGTKKTERYLRAIAARNSETPPPRMTPTTNLKPGMRLMREWNGRTHVVDVIDDGFRYHGRTYASLSAVARSITGSRWSGPRFFGLTA